MVFDYQIALKVNDKNVFQYKFYLHTSATNCETFDNNSSLLLSDGQISN